MTSKTYICPEISQKILSYGDLGTLAVGLYIDRSFNVSSEYLIEETLKELRAKKEHINVVCCRDDDRPLVTFNRGHTISVPKYHHPMAAFIYPKTYTGNFHFMIYNDNLAVLYICESKVTMYCGDIMTHGVSGHIIYVDNLCDVPQQLKHEEIVNGKYMGSTYNSIYIINFNETSSLKNNVITHNGQKRILRRAYLGYFEPIFVDIDQGILYDSSIVLHKIDEEYRPKKLLH